MDSDAEEKLKSALWYNIGQFVDDMCVEEQISNATPQFIGALTEMVWSQIANVSRDLETFAKHGGRSTVNTDDVMLLARRNEGLEELLKAFVETFRVKEGRAGAAGGTAQKRGQAQQGGSHKGKTRKT